MSRSTECRAHRIRRGLAWQLLVGAGLLLVAPSARATPNFPPVIKAQLGLSDEPACATCHAGGNTGKNTVNTPFGTTLRSRGLVAYNEGSLITALMAIGAEKKDSDGDGVIDIDELKMGTDPNAGAAGGEEDPEYGCAAAHRPASPTERGWPLGILVVAGMLLASRRFLAAVGRAAPPRDRP